MKQLVDANGVVIPGLVKNDQGVILAVDSDELNKYLRQRDAMNQREAEIESMKNEIEELKNIVKQLVNK